MNRNETIDRISRRLSTIDDETLAVIRDLVDEPFANRANTRALTTDELAEVEESKADFAAGRTMSVDELNAFLDAAAARRRSGGP